MNDQDIPIAVVATQVAPRTKPSNYPEPFASRMAGREKRSLGDLFGLSNFGVNLTKLLPGAGSALRHAHSKQDEFIYILHGHPVLVTDDGETQLSPGMCAGFKAVQATRTSCLIVQVKKCITLRLATAVQKIPQYTRTMTYRQFSSMENGGLHTKTVRHIETHTNLTPLLDFKRQSSRVINNHTNKGDFFLKLMLFSMR